MTIRVLALVEGQTEEKFAKTIIVPFLAERDILLEVEPLAKVNPMRMNFISFRPRLQSHFPTLMLFAYTPLGVYMLRGLFHGLRSLCSLHPWLLAHTSFGGSEAAKAAQASSNGF